MAALVLAAATLLAAIEASAFCGFYVAKADADLWNQASQVAIVRDGDRTVLTMANDYQGTLDEFAIVVPVPEVLEKDQIHVGSRRLLERLDAFSAPRLVEYFDENPCQPPRILMERSAAQSPGLAFDAGAKKRAGALGVSIEARYTVGEYDILILSAKQSDGLVTWLRENGYRLPEGASRALRPYIRQDMKFFVAKVNLKEQAKSGFNYLRPLQMAFRSKRFMLPIRLGMLNADGPQDLLVYLLTRKGRVETSNYRTVRVPSGAELPVFVKTEFDDFYRAMFDSAWNKERKSAVFLEYFWDMAWCDPCAANPLSADELREIGVFWLSGAGGGGRRPAGARPPRPGPQNVLLTRLHVRYDDDHFAEDLMFHETRDRKNFQGRFVLRHPYSGPMNCGQAEHYLRKVRERQDREFETLARLTGWPISDIRDKAGIGDPLPNGGKYEVEGEDDEKDSWWKRLWNDDQ